MENYNISIFPGLIINVFIYGLIELLCEENDKIERGVSVIPKNRQQM